MDFVNSNPFISSFLSFLIGIGVTLISFHVRQSLFVDQLSEFKHDFSKLKDNIVFRSSCTHCEKNLTTQFNALKFLFKSIETQLIDIRNRLDGKD
jgi:hypothetical protein